MSYLERKTAIKMNFTDCMKRANSLSSPKGDSFSGLLCRQKDLNRIVFLVNLHERNLIEIENLQRENKKLQEAINESPLGLYANKENWLDTHKSPNQRFMIIKVEDGERDMSIPHSPTYGGKSARSWIKKFGYLRSNQVINEVK